jgi:hypothetical protein
VLRRYGQQKSFVFGEKNKQKNYITNAADALLVHTDFK